MNENPNEEIVRVATGDMVQMELCQQILLDAGIDCRVVGGELDSGLGTALAGSVELWVHEHDQARAEELLQNAGHGQE